MAVYGKTLKTIYGSSAEAVRKDLVPFTFSFSREDGKRNNMRVYVNKHVMYARLVRVNDKLKKNGVKYTIHNLGCFNWRRIRGSLSMSMHSGAIALDINPAQNPMKFGKLVTDMPKGFIEAFESEGFTWGGRWIRKDAMHFELKTHTEPAKLPRVVKKTV
jgi:hypothetical protein